MVYKRGRFVIHYKDGTTYIEDRNDPHSWDNRPIKPIKAIGIQPDPIIYLNEIRTDPETGKETKRQISVNLESTDPNVKYVMEEITLKGSFKHNYQFFIDKHSDLRVVANETSDTWGIRMGVVVDNLGHCFCLEYVGTGSPRGYYTTLRSLGMDRNSQEKNYQINLEELPSPEDTVNLPYPEIDPLIITKRKERLLKQQESVVNA